MKSLLIRSASGVALLAVVAGATLTSQWSFGALLLVITIGCVYEFYRISRLGGYRPLSLMGLAASISIFVFAFDGFFNSSDLSIPISLFVIALVPLIFVAEIFRCSDSPIVNIAVTLMPLLYIAAPIAMLAGIPIQICAGEWNPYVMLLYMIVVWSNDIFAYLVGVSCGKHLLCEHISPKKTWEGLLGGVLGSMVIAVCVANILDQSVALWIGVSLITSTTGVLGDLVESSFKRSVDIKDSGNVMPGHGGWLDRFDSLILSAPFVFVYLLILTLIK